MNIKIYDIGKVALKLVGETHCLSNNNNARNCQRIREQAEQHTAIRQTDTQFFKWKYRAIQGYIEELDEEKTKRERVSALNKFNFYTAK